AGSRNEDIQIYLDLKVDGLQIQADPTRLAQVLDNLLTNAIKYAPGSRVMITLSVEQTQAHITVSDNGPGIAPEHLKSLFNRFYRVPTNNVTVRGTGLGLYICRRIIQAHGGEITAESKIGKGTTFHIRLPLKREKGNEDNETSISLRESNP
ncbi:MAG: sensor histidine kinase, partial [Anaerolineales bacterium]